MIISPTVVHGNIIQAVFSCSPFVLDNFISYHLYVLHMMFDNKTIFLFLIINTMFKLYFFSLKVIYKLRNMIMNQEEK